MPNSPVDAYTRTGPWTREQSCQLALLIFLRFGKDLPQAAAAWRRMLENDCSDSAFAKLVWDSGSKEATAEVVAYMAVLSCYERWL